MWQAIVPGREQRDLPGTPASQRFSCPYLCQGTWLPEIFFHRASSKQGGKKGHWCPAAGPADGFQKDGGDALLRIGLCLGSPGSWAFSSLLLPVSEKWKKNISITAFCTVHLSVPHEGISQQGKRGRLQPARAVAPRHRPMALGALSHLNPFDQNGKSCSNNPHGHFKHILWLLAMSYHLE